MAGALQAMLMRRSAGAAVYDHLKFVAQDYVLANTTGSMYIPVSAKAGDLAVLLETSRSTTTTPPTTRYATGFTSITTTSNSASGNAARLQASYRVLTQTDIDNGIAASGLDGANDFKVMTILRGYDAAETNEAPFASISVTQVAQGSTAGTPADQNKTVSTLDDKSAVFALYACNSNNIISGSNFMLQNGVEVADAQLVMNTLSSGGRYKILAGGNTITCRLTDTGSANLILSFVITAN